jgi:hypothetical protein
MTIRAARVDAQGVFVAVDELPDETALTARHLPQVAECDLPPGKYQWDGERFVPLPAAQRRQADDTPSLEEVVFLIARDLGEAAAPRVQRWVQWYRKTVDRG